ncbi:unnamed protein product [Polarella glacialis]|uniref:Uncharacterized protein n=1 Tax=Polarella glacialis TaxID=89957 RepID=A0A813L1W1_POLGL|nr:unnamed protein product [Polarella glacialis]
MLPRLEMVLRDAHLQMSRCKTWSGSAHGHFGHRCASILLASSVFSKLLHSVFWLSSTTANIAGSGTHHMRFILVQLAMARRFRSCTKLCYEYFNTCRAQANAVGPEASCQTQPLPDIQA